MKSLVAVFVFVFLALFSGCATVINGTTQRIDVDSVPQGAVVYVDGSQYGTTPAVLSLSRNSEHTVRIAKEGYGSREVRVTKKFNTTTSGNFFIGGLIGVAVDAGSGAMYDLEPKWINVSLVREGNIREEGIYRRVSKSELD